MASLNPEGFPDDINLDQAPLPLHIDSSIIMDPGSIPDLPTTPITPSQGKGSNNPIAATPQSALCTQKRRSSTRSIKRKKFDDELVESSLTKTERARPRLSSTSSVTLPGVPLTPTSGTQTPLLPTSSTDLIIPTESSTLVSVTAPLVVGQANTVTSGVAPPMLSTQPAATAPAPPPVTDTITVTPQIPAPPPQPMPEKKKSKSSSKRTKKTKPLPAGSTKDLGRWKPQDDLALINAVQQTCDLTAVFHGVKFSCRFTLKEIQERWYALMYDSVLSKLAIQAIKQLHPDVLAEVNSKALYSKDEEALLKQITSTSQPSVDTFEDLLQNHPSIFHSGRTAKVLHSHWLLMKQYHLLPDQSVPPMPKGDHVLNFSDAEDMINDEELKDPTDEILEQELAVADRRQKREIRHVEQELPKWQVLVDSVTGISPPDFDNQTLAVLRGRLVRYLMRSREITLGRATKDNQIDVDLSLEGPAWKISRRQGMIKLKNCGDFYIANEGKRPLYIDGKPVLTGNKHKLNNNSVVEISCLRFIFLINQDLITVIRQEAHKSAT